MLLAVQAISTILQTLASAVDTLTSHDLSCALVIFHDSDMNRCILMLSILLLCDPSGWVLHRGVLQSVTVELLSCLFIWMLKSTALASLGVFSVLCWPGCVEVSVLKN